MDVLRTELGGNYEHFTIGVHGEAGRMFPSVKFQDRVVYRPIRASRLPKYIAKDPGFKAARESESWGTGHSSGQIKLISCNGGWSNAQKIADALQLPVWAAYKTLRIMEVPKWHLFEP